MNNSKYQLLCGLQKGIDDISTKSEYISKKYNTKFTNKNVIEYLQSGCTLQNIEREYCRSHKINYKEENKTEEKHYRFTSKKIDDLTPSQQTELRWTLGQYHIIPDSDDLSKSVELLKNKIKEEGVELRKKYNTNK